MQLRNAIAVLLTTLILAGCENAEKQTRYVKAPFESAGPREPQLARGSGHRGGAQTRARARARARGRDTQVVATGSATGGTQVYQNGVWSNAVTFTVTP